MANKFKTQFAHDRLQGLEFKKPSLTQQSFGYETDINNIVNSMIQPNVNHNSPLFGETVDPNLYDTALNVMADAKSKFETLPSAVRKEFANDPKRLLDFVADDKNYDRAVELGLIPKRVQKEVFEPLPIEKPVQGIVDSSPSTITEASSQ